MKHVWIKGEKRAQIEGTKAYNEGGRERGKSVQKEKGAEMEGGMEEEDSREGGG